MHLTKQIILDALERFIHSEKNSIFGFVGCANSVDLESFYFMYRYGKIYDNLFGDSVPFFVAKALDIKITVFEICQPNVRQTLLNHESLSEVSLEVLRTERPKHYNGLVKIPPFQPAIELTTGKNNVSATCSMRGGRNNTYKQVK